MYPLLQPKSPRCHNVALQSFVGLWAEDHPVEPKLSVGNSNGSRPPLAGGFTHRATGGLHGSRFPVCLRHFLGFLRL